MAKKFIQKATANAHGQFRRKAEAAGKSTAEFAKEHEHSSGLLGKQARLAETLMGLSHHKGSATEGKKRKSLTYSHPRSPKE